MTADVEGSADQPGRPIVQVRVPSNEGAPFVVPRIVRSLTQQDRIRLKNLLENAHEQLMASGWRRPDVAELLKPAAEMLDDHEFWQHQEEGLAVFLTTDLAEWYRLPKSFEPVVVVEDRFYIKPLLDVMSRGERFYILALSQNEVRLLYCRSDLETRRNHARRRQLRDTGRGGKLRQCSDTDVVQQTILRRRYGASPPPPRRVTS